MSALATLQQTSFRIFSLFNAKASLEKAVNGASLIILGMTMLVPKGRISTYKS